MQRPTLYRSYFPWCTALNQMAGIVTCYLVVLAVGLVVREVISAKCWLIVYTAYNRISGLGHIPIQNNPLIPCTPCYSHQPPMEQGSLRFNLKGIIIIIPWHDIVTPKLDTLSIIDDYHCRADDFYSSWHTNLPQFLLGTRDEGPLDCCRLYCVEIPQSVRWNTTPLMPFP